MMTSQRKNLNDNHVGRKHYLQLPPLQIPPQEPPQHNINSPQCRQPSNRKNFRPILSNIRLTFEQLTSSQPEFEHAPDDLTFPVRRGHKSPRPPAITICPPEGSDVICVKCDEPDIEELDNQEFLSPHSVPSDEKHEVYAGRLVLIRHTGSGLNSPDSPSSPATPTKAPRTAFPFRPASPITARDSPPRSPATRRAVFVRVYRCYSDHFAVVSRDRLYTSQSVYINLRRCRLLPGDRLGRFLLAGKMDSGDLIEFEATDMSTLSHWLDAFQSVTPPPSPGRGVSGLRSPGIPASPHMPALAETDEED